MAHNHVLPIFVEAKVFQLPAKKLLPWLRLQPLSKKEIVGAASLLYLRLMLPGWVAKPRCKPRSSSPNGRNALLFLIIKLPASPNINTYGYIKRSFLDDGIINPVMKIDKTNKRNLPQLKLYSEVSAPKRKNRNKYRDKSTLGPISKLTTEKVNRKG